MRADLICTDGQSSWTQPPSSSVSLGGTTISCITQSSYPIGWHQQKAGQVPWLLMYATGNRASGTPARFSGSKSANTMSLIITESQLEDDATYYCVVVWGGSGLHICSLGWGTEIKPSQQELNQVQKFGSFLLSRRPQ
uniref:Ig-like domain-containing protein n=1 Tax=Naja naja TaxID=35670 RepID=A0A8C6VKY1_NAJNA